MHEKPLVAATSTESYFKGPSEGSTLLLAASIAHNSRDLLRFASHGALLIDIILLATPEAAVAKVYWHGC